FRCPMVSLSVRNVIMEMSIEERSIAPLPSISNRVPVFHIFGSLPTGEKACLHVHGVLPYIMLRVGGAYSIEMSGAIENRINNLIKNELEKEGIDQKSSKGFVVSTEKIVGRSIYGFHPSDEDFVKIRFASPFYSSRAASSLSSISSPLLQPFDAHVPFHLQFAIDHSIFGMDFVSVRNARFRLKRSRCDDDDLFGTYSVEAVMRDPNLLSPLSPQTSSHIEVDVLAEDIINHELHANNEYSMNPGIEYIWKDEIERRKGEAVIDTFTKCCQEKRPSNQLNTEKEFLSRLRENVDGLKERLAGMNWKESFYESLNETELTKAWNALESTLKERPPSRSSAETEAEIEKGVDKTVWNVASQKDEEWMWKGDEEDDEGGNDEDEKRAMMHTFAQIEKDAEVEDLMEKEDDTHVVAGLVKRLERGSKESQESDKTVVPTQFNIKKAKKRIWRGISKKLPKVCGLDGKKREEEKEEKKIEIEKKKRQEKDIKGDAKSYHNRFDATSTQPATTLMLCTPMMSEDDSELRGALRYLSVVSLELSTLTTSLMPNHMEDPIIAVSVCLYSDVCVQSSPDTHIVFIVGKDLPSLDDHSHVFAVPSENDLIETVIKFTKRCDPDLLIGYDCDRLSWGYFFRRCNALRIRAYIDLCRISPRGEPTISPAGRLTLSVWRIVRSDLKLRSYDRATAYFDVAKKKIPTFDQSTLARFYTEETKRSRSILADILLRYSKCNVDILLGMNFFAITAEMARVYGIQFEEVMTRGTQLRVESMLLRFCRRLGLFAPSITPEQRNQMRAPEQLQLVMEPQSGVYFDPVIVLDFQSLYPSMAIAYNYCYSTCVGGVSQSASLSQGVHDVELGALTYRVPIRSLIRLTSEEKVHISPLGTVYLKWNEREGIVPKMLREILAARIMVKQAAKVCTSKRLGRILDARQLALKLVANVTYGYTAANWSGRMPCVEVADAILGKGRETLERAINLVNEGGVKYMGAQVIYGDTDSLFVLVQGATMEEAFKVGKAIADDVTADNPAPVVLKLEKVYNGCVLQTKKKYAGMSFESENEKEGKFDAKGIETVRRDTCPVVARMLERSLGFLFHRDFRGLSKYLDKKLSKINELPYTDFVFCKEYRGDYSPLAHVPQAKIAEQDTAMCQYATPLVGDRVPYVVVDGKASATVYSCVRSIEEFLQNPFEDIHYAYYVQAHITAALHRCLSLIPITIHWEPYPKPMCTTPHCYCECSDHLCTHCISSKHSLQSLIIQSARVSRTLSGCKKYCISCVGCSTPSISSCRSLSCPIHKILVSMRKNRTDRALSTHPMFCRRNELDF
ncbi:rev-3, partial [Pristionchus pacificus]